MKKIYLGLLSIALAATGCQNQSNKTAEQASAAAMAGDTLSYTYDSVKVYSKTPLSKDPGVTDTAKATLKFPVFYDTLLNAFLKNKILMLSQMGEKGPEGSYQELAGNFIKEFDAFQAENQDRIQTWFLDAKANVLKQHPGYLPLQYTFVTYAGGAHPNSMFTYINYDVRNKKEILLTDLIVEDGMAKLTAAAERIFRKNEKLAPDASLKDQYFFENDIFKLNDNFTLTKEGLKFLYNPYEIKAYVFGTTELLIPYSDLTDILKPNTIANTLK